MDQLVNLVLVIDKVHTAPQMALDCRPDLGRGLWPNHPTPSA